MTIIKNSRMGKEIDLREGATLLVTYILMFYESSKWENRWINNDRRMTKVRYDVAHLLSFMTSGIIYLHVYSKQIKEQQT